MPQCTHAFAGRSTASFRRSLVARGGGEYLGPMKPAPTADLDSLESFVRRHPRLLVLTGAGISIGSGIPAYRGATVEVIPLGRFVLLDGVITEYERRLKKNG